MTTNIPLILSHDSSTISYIEHIFHYFDHISCANHTATQKRHVLGYTP